MRMVFWDEQGNKPNEFVLRSAPDHLCISFQHEEAKKHGYIYQSDEDALQDFMAIHWAWFKEEQ